jgi:hypothetical protein
LDPINQLILLKENFMKKLIIVAAVLAMSAFAFADENGAPAAAPAAGTNMSAPANAGKMDNKMDTTTEKKMKKTTKTTTHHHAKKAAKPAAETPAAQ